MSLHENNVTVQYQRSNSIKYFPVVHKRGLGQLLVQSLTNLTTNAFTYPGIGLLIMTTGTIPFRSPVFVGFWVCLPTRLFQRFPLQTMLVSCIAFVYDLLLADSAAGNQSMLRPVIPPQNLAQARQQKAQGTEVASTAQTMTHGIVLSSRLQM